MKRFLVLCSMVFILLVGGTSVWAHDSVYDGTIELSLEQMTEISHSDADPWKGTLSLTVTNIGTNEWGDFHFSINSDVYANVFFTDEVIPTMSKDIDNYYYVISDDGYSLDFFYDEDPVGTGESVTFNIFTNNTTDNNGLFYVSMWPSPVDSSQGSTVPVPSTVCLLGIGLLVMTRTLRDDQI